MEGDLKSVWEKLTGKVDTLEALDEHLTWTRRDPEGAGWAWRGPHLHLNTPERP